jgi:hypothetical protein
MTTSSVEMQPYPLPPSHSNSLHRPYTHFSFLNNWQTGNQAPQMALHQTCMPMINEEDVVQIGRRINTEPCFQESKHVQRSTFGPRKFGAAAKHQKEAVKLR